MGNRSFKPVVLSQFDVEMLQFINRFHSVRPHHIVGWTGASAFHVRNRLTLLSNAGLVEPYKTAQPLRNGDGLVTDTICTMWRVTNRGAFRAGAWVVPGTEGQIVELPARKLSVATIAHATGVVDLAVWYRQYGFEVASEREILSLERESKIAPDKIILPHWTVMPAGARAVHSPDFGVIRNNVMYAVELELAVKGVKDYMNVISAYMGANRPQIWHVEKQKTLARLQEACRLLGVQWHTGHNRTDVMVSTDGMIRFQGYKYGRSGLRGAHTWENAFPRIAPAGFSSPETPPDLRAQWKIGRTINEYTPQTNAGRVL